MAVLDMKPAKFGAEPFHLWFVPANTSERHSALGIVGATPAKGKPDVYFPPDPLIVDQLVSAMNGHLTLSGAVQHWYKDFEDHADRSLDIRGADDLVSAAPWGSRLYPYQRVGACWMEHVRRGILGDDPGLGKTIQSLTAVRNCDNVLIVTLNAVKHHWARHIRDWLGYEVGVCDGTRPQRVSVLESKPPWVIINHEMLRPSLKFPDLLSRDWDAVIVDEAHKFQSKDSQQSKGAETLKSDYLLLLTGTPIWNRADSIWNLLHLLYPRRFGSYWRFVNEYCTVITTPWGTEILGLKPDKVSALQTLLVPLLLRRRKQDVLPDLPPKIVQTVEYDLTPAQRKAYRDVKRKLVLMDEEGVTLKNYNHAIQTLGDLRMICNAPSLVGLGDATNPKNAVLDDLLDSLVADGRKVVIFTWYKAYAQYLASRYHWYGKKPDANVAPQTVLVTGDTPNRDAVIQTWRQDSTPILVATIAASGTGIDLVEATAAIFAEGSYVNAVNVQAEDRLHRIGIKDSPLIYRVQAKGTLEATIWETSDETGAANDDILTIKNVLWRLSRQETI